jgi:hypothetical protein
MSGHSDWESLAAGWSQPRTLFCKIATADRLMVPKAYVRAEPGDRATRSRIRVLPLHLMVQRLISPGMSFWIPYLPRRFAR